MSGASDDSEVDDTLRHVLQDGNPLLQITAFESLTDRDRLIEEDVDIVLNLIATEESTVRSQAASSLRNLATSRWSRKCADGLAPLLQDADPTVVAIAATTLGDFGNAAISYRDSLVQVGDDAVDEFVAESVANALSRIPENESKTGNNVLPPASKDDSTGQVFLPIVE